MCYLGRTMVNDQGQMSPLEPDAGTHRDKDPMGDRLEALSQRIAIFKQFATYDGPYISTAPLVKEIRANSIILADIMRRHCEILVLLEHEIEELKKGSSNH